MRADPRKPKALPGSGLGFGEDNLRLLVVGEEHDAKVCQGAGSINARPTARCPMAPSMAQRTSPRPSRRMSLTSSYWDGAR